MVFRLKCPHTAKPLAALIHKFNRPIIIPHYLDASGYAFCQMDILEFNYL